MRLYGDAGVAIATGVLTFVVLVFCRSPAQNYRPRSIRKSGLSAAFLLAPLNTDDAAGTVPLTCITRLLMRLMGN